MIIDEAHERSLNIDFLLGYLRRLLPRRPDLKVIITSATIDTGSGSPTPLRRTRPVIEVSGRTYPGRDPLPPAVGSEDDDDGERRATRPQAIVRRRRAS